MKRIDIRIGLVWLLAASFFGSCRQEAEVSTEPVEIQLRAAVSAHTRASVDPNGSGLPTQPLDIGIVMLPFPTKSPAPTTKDWSGMLHWQRAEFQTNGNIKFRNEDNTAYQQLFYDETGLYDFMIGVYPYANVEVGKSMDGGLIVFHDINGSQDIMSSEQVGGSASDPIYPAIDGAFTFYHRLAKLKVKLRAENDAVVTQYGKITEIKLINQPGDIMLHVYDDEASSASAQDTTSYPLVGFESKGLTVVELAKDAVDFGYVMAVPARKYTFKITTEQRLSFYVNLSFPLTENGATKAVAGKMYELVFKFMDADEIEVYALLPKDYWMDSTFD